MIKLHGFIAAGMISLACVSAFGQTYKNFDVELNEIRTRGRLRLGPFRIIPELRLTNIGHDDNVYFRNTAEKVPGDYTGTVSPEVRAYLLLGRSLILSCTENPEYQYFVKEAPLRRFTNSFEPGARLRLFNRLVFSGSYHFLEHQRRASSEFSSLVTDTDKGVKVAAFYETPRGSAIGVTQEVERFLYEDISLPGNEILLSKSLNRKESSGSAEFYYPVFAESFFFVTARATTYEFEDPSYRWKNSRSFQVSSGLRFPFMGRARGTLSLGYKKFTPDSKGQRSYSGLIADTNLDFRFGRIELRFGLGRDNYFSYLEEALFFVEDRVSPGISFRLTRRFRLDYDLRYTWLRYPEPFQFPGPGGEPVKIDRRDTHRVHSIGLSIFFLRKTGIQLSYNLMERTSNAPGFNVNRNFFGVSLIQDF